MMTSHEYIISKLEDFVKIFHQTRARYEIGNDGVTHIIEIVPNEVYHMDDSYLEWEDQFFNDFVRQFPYENICFITDDSALSIIRPIFTVEGLSYAPISTHEETGFEIHTPTLVSGSTVFNQIISFDWSKIHAPEKRTDILPTSYEYALAA